jgi:hypothetical protein
MTPGHRVMTSEQIALIEKVRALGIAIEGVLIEVDAHYQACLDWVDNQKVPVECDLHPEAVRLMKAEPHRWLAMARTDLQCGLMKLTRAVAQPEFF